MLIEIHPKLTSRETFAVFSLAGATKKVTGVCAYVSLALSAMVFLLLSTEVLGQEDQATELKEIQRQIEQKQRQIEKQLSSAKRLEGDLRKAELEISETAKALNRTQITLENNLQRQLELTQQQRDLKAKQQQQQSLLAKQLRSAYMAGNYDYAKMVFNQQDAGKFERVLSYYQYLNKARQSQITSFRELSVELAQVTEDLRVKQVELEELQKQQKTQRNILTGQQTHRKQTLSQIRQVINSEAAQIEQLQINEQSLLKAIQQAEALARQQPQELKGLAGLKGQLLKPTNGRMQRLFGKRRQGQVRWKGVLISGNSGSPVRSVHHGTILYADWLRGFGLVTVVDHGQGYMSLYGHNQALLKQVGDTVESGETIALVGQSGGQSSPNLYFEIRFKGQAVNPSSWLKR